MANTPDEKSIKAEFRERIERGEDVFKSYELMLKDVRKLENQSYLHATHLSFLVGECMRIEMPIEQFDRLMDKITHKGTRLCTNVKISSHDAPSTRDIGNVRFLFETVFDEMLEGQNASTFRPIKTETGTSFVVFEKENPSSIFKGRELDKRKAAYFINIANRQYEPIKDAIGLISWSTPMQQAGIGNNVQIIELALNINNQQTRIEDSLANWIYTHAKAVEHKDSPQRMALLNPRLSAAYARHFIRQNTNKQNGMMILDAANAAALGLLDKQSLFKTINGQMAEVFRANDNFIQGLTDKTSNNSFMTSLGVFVSTTLKMFDAQTTIGCIKANGTLTENLVPCLAAKMNNIPESLTREQAATLMDNMKTLLGTKGTRFHMFMNTQDLIPTDEDMARISSETEKILLMKKSPLPVKPNRQTV